MSRGVSAGVKVGILFLLATLGVYLVWKNLSSDPAGTDNYVLWAKFRDASGLPVGSKVVVAGLPVGEISSLSIDGRYARVNLRIRRDVPVWSSAVLYKKATSLLGDHYLEIDPGAELMTGPDGRQEEYTRLLGNLTATPEDDQILRVVESTSIDTLLRRIDETLPDVDAAIASIKDLSEDLRRLIRGPIASIATNIDELVQKESQTVADILIKLERSMDQFNQAVAEGRATLRDADESLDRVFDNLEGASAEARALMATARDEIEKTGGKLQEKLDMVDEVIAATESISKKIDEDRGTLGRLVNDPTIADNVEEITEDAKGFLGTLFGLQTYVGLRSEFNFRARAARHYVSVELHTRPDKYYLIELERGPRGDYPEVTLEYDPTNPVFPDAWVRRTVIRDETRFTFQFAKRFGWLTLRYGLKESTGGVGADADVRWWNRDLKLSLDAFDTAFDRLPRVKLAAAFEVFRFVYVLGGIDEALNAPAELQIVTGMDDVPAQFDTFKYGRDVFLGAMIRFNDQDLAALLAVGGSAIGGAAD
jgi:phospholipid/cholesterol/gamma-HCH transport system substrate-binding protein